MPLLTCWLLTETGGRWLALFLVFLHHAQLNRIQHDYCNALVSDIVLCTISSRRTRTSWNCVRAMSFVLWRNARMAGLWASWKPRNSSERFLEILFSKFYHRRWSVSSTFIGMNSPHSISTNSTNQFTHMHNYIARVDQEWILALLMQMNSPVPSAVCLWVVHKIAIIQSVAYIGPLWQTKNFSP